MSRIYPIQNRSSLLITRLPLVVLFILGFTLPSCIRPDFKAVYLTTPFLQSQDETLPATRKMAEIVGIDIISIEQSTIPTELATQIESAQVIYLEPEVLAMVDQRLVQGWYRQEKVLVAINTKLSTLTEKLNISPSVPDFKEEISSARSNHCVYGSTVLYRKIIW